MINKSTFILALCSVLILFMYACQDNVSPNLEESLDLFAGLEAIPEAQSTNVTINKGTAATDGYFTIKIDKVNDTPLLAPASTRRGAWNGTKTSAPTGTSTRK